MRSAVLINLLKVCVSITLFSRGWLIWKWDSPIRSLIWNEGWWGTRVNWQDFANHSDQPITLGLEVFGICLIASSILPWLTSHLKWIRWIFLPLSGALLVEAFGGFVNSGYQFGMAIEHSLQWLTPLLLFLALQKPSNRHWVFIALVASALTFIGHGLYAAGIHPVPFKYQTMTSTLLKLGESGTLTFLKIAGYLDFAAALGLLIPILRNFCLGYMVVWGAATALARITTGPSMDPWLMETLVRSSHWVVPLILFLYLKQNNHAQLDS